jgi:hypothetical protein
MTRQYSSAFRFISPEQDASERKARRERFAGGKVHTLERDVLASCLDLLAKHPAVAYAHRVNTGCGYVLDATTYHALVKAGHLRQGQARFMRFSFKGAADISGLLRGSGKRLEVECKSDSGKATEEQEAFIDATNVGGGKALIVRSVDELVQGLASV